ncbi:MAG TPA: tripartite tricarboxylate transporter substrate-binding protein [Hyphomicrobiaceae bacterium]|nr:tripartite tricarboxylate transporter substrate-binding protein [Hyphomicrobiaceae bacterium]
MTGRNRLRLKVAAGTALALGAATAAQAQQADFEFFKGKTVTYIIATSPGGGYDYYGRLVAEFMQRHLPGSTFVVRNMPGAGHIIGANFIYASKPDGLTIGTFNTGLIYSQLIAADAIKFDLTKMSWIGKAATDPRVFVISEKSPIKTFADLKASKEVIFSTSGVGSAGYAETKALSDVLGLPIKIVTGYSGSEDQLAMRRGEVTGVVNTRSSNEEFVKNGYGRFIAQIGGREKDVPQLSSFVQDADAKALVALIQSQGDIARLTAGPPGIPPERLAALRAAYKAAMEDKELQEKAAKGGRPLEPAYGEEVAAMVKAALNQSPKAVAILKEALSEPAGQASSVVKATGPLLEIRESGKRITVNGPDGKQVDLEVSSSRTKITVAGKEAQRGQLKVGQECEITYPPGGTEAAALACK